MRPRSPFQISEDDMREFYFGSIKDLLKFRHSSDASIEKVIKKANAMPRLIEEFYRSINVRRT